MRPCMSASMPCEVTLCCGGVNCDALCCVEWCCPVGKRVQVQLSQSVRDLHRQEGDEHKSNTWSTGYGV